MQSCVDIIIIIIMCINRFYLHEIAMMRLREHVTSIPWPYAVYLVLGKCLPAADFRRKRAYILDRIKRRSGRCYRTLSHQKPPSRRTRIIRPISKARSRLIEITDWRMTRSSIIHTVWNHVFIQKRTHVLTYIYWCVCVCMNRWTRVLIFLPRKIVCAPQFDEFCQSAKNK